VIDVVVLPEFQKHGHGRTMMQSLIDHAGAHNVMLHSHRARSRSTRASGFAG